MNRYMFTMYMYNQANVCDHGQVYRVAAKEFRVHTHTHTHTHTHIQRTAGVQTHPAAE